MLTRSGNFNHQLPSLASSGKGTFPPQLLLLLEGCFSLPSATLQAPTLYGSLPVAGSEGTGSTSPQLAPPVATFWAPHPELAGFPQPAVAADALSTIGVGELLPLLCCLVAVKELEPFQSSILYWFHCPPPAVVWDTPLDPLLQSLLRADVLFQEPEAVGDVLEPFQSLLPLDELFQDGPDTA